ncbi:DUF4190 domain-containing protein [Glutamicibacter sp. NPDC087344]|uniref:DUF4190 domain-containing protein n=1 Tax=Glutamicibacter sp. NPDC087344 TaxID=3363994 RepID=UPI0038217936
MESVNNSPQTSPMRLNRLSILALGLAIAEIFALMFLGGTGLAVFAVGTGHMALHQIKARTEAGASLATAALVIGYAVAAFGVLSTAQVLLYMAF